MDAWSIYERRAAAHGGTKRGAALVRETRFINSHLADNLSYQAVEICPAGYGFNIDSDSAAAYRRSQNVAILDSDSFDEKSVCSLPGEDIRMGELILWENEHWLVTERNAADEVYTKAKMLRCNHLLKWISDDGEIMEQWCVIEDGTKYMTGEKESSGFVVTRGDLRISLQIAKNEHTVRFDRERRFLIDDPDAPHKLAYILSKPFRKGFTYNDDGTFKFILQEVTATDYDNHELGIADYYRHFSRDEILTTSDGESLTATDDDGQEVYLVSHTPGSVPKTTVVDPENNKDENGRSVWI